MGTDYQMHSTKLKVKDTFDKEKGFKIKIPQYQWVQYQSSSKSLGAIVPTTPKLTIPLRQPILAQLMTQIIEAANFFDKSA